MKPSRKILQFSVILSALSPIFVQAQAQEPSAKPQTGPTAGAQYPGPTENGFLLPNGWTLSPAGDQVEITDLPLNIHPLPGNQYAVVGTAGYNAHKLSLIDLQSKKVVSDITSSQSWFGLATNADASHFWWSGGGLGSLVEVHRTGQTLKLAEPAAKAADKPLTKGKNLPFTSGVTINAKEKKLYQLDINRGSLTETLLDDTKATRTATVAERPYDVLVGNEGKFLYISDWSARLVLAVDAQTLKVVHRFGVGEHPNQMVLHPKDGRLFVACASSNAVYVIDTNRWVVGEIISTSLFPRAPEGSTPDALAISPDGEMLYVANADNNCIAVVDVEHPNRSVVEGFIPTGWYPTSVAVTPDGKNLLVGVGKGNQTKPNPITKESREELKKLTETDEFKALPEVTRARLATRKYPYIGTTLTGSLSIIKMPDADQLAEYTSVVYRNCPYSDLMLQVTKPSSRKTVIPTKVGQKSPIEHVLYIIKENRTYDQVLGDMPRGNGDPSLVLFGEEVTPNHHKLATEFVLLDNLYCNGHVSADGHPWSTSAYNTDYTARNWALTYSRRAGVDDDDEGELARPPSGYIWDLCARKGLTYRSYGEYGSRVSQPDGSLKMEGRAPGLVGHMSPDYGIGKKGQRVRDTHNADVFIREFDDYCKNDNLPNFMIMSLGEDHTDGTRPGSFTPQACVASNDLALGRIVDAISHSKYWPKIAIFVIQDDAQNGPDHVDAHRTVGFAISAYTRRGHLDSTQYSTSGMLRTMELILGLPPMSQFDASATPMFESFTDKLDLTPYSHVPNKIDLNAKNTALAYGAERSSKMDFSDYDRIDDFELNEILWRAIKGADAPIPPAVRRAIAFRAVEPPAKSASGK